VTGSTVPPTPHRGGGGERAPRHRLAYVCRAGSSGSHLTRPRSPSAHGAAAGPRPY